MNSHPSNHRRAVVGGAVLLAAFLFAVPAIAHHGWGGYAQKTSEISGTVESPVSMAGPHATMRVKVENQVWDVVLAPPTRAQQAGLKDGMIAVGEKVTVHGNRHSDPKKFEMKTSRLTWNGKVFNVYPDRD
ncbi:MAG: DUF6152 family protein [Acidobacteriota bacterium]